MKKILIDTNIYSFAMRGDREVIRILKKAGTPVPTNDIWIAAAAFQHGLKLFTKDAHFSFVKGLMLV